MLGLQVLWVPDSIFQLGSVQSGLGAHFGACRSVNTSYYKLSARMTFPGANSGKNSALHRGVWTPLWGSAVHHHLCPWSTEVCAIAIIQNMEEEFIQTMEGESKVRWSKREANCVGNIQQHSNPPKAPLQRERLRLLRSLGCALPSADLSACKGWELILAASSCPGH